MPLPLSVNVDIGAARESLLRVSERVAALLQSAPDPRAVVRGSEWNVGEIAAHLALIGEFYTQNASGGTAPFVDVSDVGGGTTARSNKARLEAEPERDLGALAVRLTDGSRRLVEATGGRSTDELVMWNGEPVGLGALLGIALGEYLVHGRDLAEALSRDWVIDPDDARLVLASTLPLLRLLVNVDATAKVHASYDLRVRGGTRLTVLIDHGQLTVEEPGNPVDCHVSAEPIALLLIAYGRRSPWVPALSAKIVAWGRKPWLGLRLTHYLVAP